MHNNSFFKIILIAISVVFFTSCDKDFNSIGGDLVGNDHFGLESKTFNVLAYNQKINAVQSSNLPVNALGVYEDAIFGTTTASFVTQLTLASVNPVIGNNVQVDSVILSVPYFYTQLPNPDLESGENLYRLDSIYGNKDLGKIKLNIYENGYFMRDLDPATGFLEVQRYYTNQASDFETLKGSVVLNDAADVSQNTAFFFSPKAVKEKTTTNGEATTTQSVPAMRLALNKSYFKTKIIDAAASGKLVTNDVFKNYFRGLYFKVEKSDSNLGVLSMMNFKAGKIIVYYKEDSSTDNTVKVSKSIQLNLTGNTVNLLSNDVTNATAYTNAAANPNTTTGDEKLYLKGGEGAMAVLELFEKTDLLGYDANGNVTGPNGVYDELDELRRKDPVTGKSLLINEANLVFHVDGAAMGSNKIPNRVYLYDLTNNTVIADYAFDQTRVLTDKTGHLIYGGLLNPVNTEDKTYKFRITNHIRTLIQNADSTNVKLGVVVTEDINNTGMNKLRVPLQPGTTLTKAPQASVMNPLGVVLHGANSSVPADKKLKLEIYYTKPN
ncbi:protein of unknown function [Flavobacterium flevense]|uniref:DUF4270 domain-containing protein n=1 Tax=Flavobacterium flevense TaxID=983 RepID=A0A4Y4AV00_9FLAO|nr:DUF4270 domain-containing protein [Flavobacterium flevense]GEC70922.1 hypothetical protein FFL01_04610 [Flavobacterium flevense]SHL55566.1 protein of unknown function [Flavobacterium flevense]